MRRTQIYLDEAQHRELARRARAEATTRSDLIREAVNEYLARSPDRDSQLRAFRDAVEAAAGSVRRLPRGRDYVEELRRADASREADLERRRAR